MSFLQSLVKDLRERQVLPAVLLLVVLVIAIPVVGVALLSHSSAPEPVNVPPVNVSPPHGVPAPGQELATVQAPPTQRSVVFTGSEPNPFQTSASQPSGSSSSPSSKGSSSPSSHPKGASSTPSSSSHPGGSSSSPSSGSHSGGSSSGSGTPKPSSTSSKQTSAPSSLGSDEVYTVNVTTTYGSEKDQLNDLERLTPLPANVAEVVFLGVMKGGKRAAFAFTGAVPVKATAGGPFTCEPSTSDCSVVELPVNSQLTLTPDPANPSYSTFTLEVSAIGAQKLASPAAAKQARESTSAQGQALVTASTSAALASFFYNVDLGALTYQPQSSIGATGPSGATGPIGVPGATGSSGTSGASGSTG